LVHPDLRQWFADYVEGTVPLDIRGGLSKIGVNYSKKGKHLVPKRIFRDYGTKSYFLSMGKYRKIKKVGKKDPIGFEVGDSVNTEILDSLLYDEVLDKVISMKDMIFLMCEYCYDALKLFGDEDIVKEVENIITNGNECDDQIAIYNKLGFEGLNLYLIDNVEF